LPWVSDEYDLDQLAHALIVQSLLNAVCKAYTKVNFTAAVLIIFD
jgi:hypothetical protein